jgi:hypothetical protein
VLVGRDGVPSLALPLDGTAELPRRPEDQAVLRVLPALGPEAAADVAGDDADLVLGDLEDVAGQRVPDAMGILDVRVEGEALLAGVPDAPRCNCPSPLCAAMISSLPMGLFS